METYNERSDVMTLEELGYSKTDDYSGVVFKKETRQWRENLTIILRFDNDMRNVEIYTDSPTAPSVYLTPQEINAIAEYMTSQGWCDNEI